MTHPVYTQQALSRYNLPRLKRIAALMGVTPNGDKRAAQTWIDAITAHQSSQIKKVDEQALAQLEFDNYIEEQGKTFAPELTWVEITYFEHEYFVDEVMVAAITYDHDLTRPWVVLVNGVEQHRANTWARCNNYIYWHYKQGTLEEPEEQESANSSCPPSTTDNEVIAQISNECEKFGFSVSEVGIYNNGTKLGSVGCTDGSWWRVRADSQNQQPIFCYSPSDAVWWLSRFKNPPVALSIDQHLQYRLIEQMNPNQLRYLLENGELIS